MEARVPSYASIIVPTLNEAGRIRAALEASPPLLPGGHEIIVVDGSSEDSTAELADPCVTRFRKRHADGRGR